MNTTISEAALPVVARYVGRTSNIYRYIAEDLAVVDAQIADEAKKPEAVRLRDELRERAEFEAWAAAQSYRASNIDTARDSVVSEWYVSDTAALAWSAWQAALAANGKQQVGDIPTMDAGLAAWLTARGLMPNADEDGCVEMDDVIAALNEHERQLAPEQQVGEVQGPSSLVDRLREHADLYSPGELRSTLTEAAKALAARPTVESAEKLDRALGETIDQRDRYHDAADDLAGHIARITRVEIGEHSSDNCPWENAMRAAAAYKSPNLGEIRQFRAFMEFALWQALNLPETDPRRDFIRQGNHLMALIHGQAVQS